MITIQEQAKYIVQLYADIVLKPCIDEGFHFMFTGAEERTFKTGEERLAEFYKAKDEYYKTLT